jgi:hypothetical protein
MKPKGGGMNEIGNKDFTIEGWMKKVRRTYRWRGRKFVCAKWVGRFDLVTCVPFIKYSGSFVDPTEIYPIGTPHGPSA